MNPIAFHPRFPHIIEKIFNFLDIKSLKNLRNVAKPWQECIDGQNFLWNKIENTIGGNKAFQLACVKGHLKMVNFLMQRPSKFDIEVNAEFERVYMRYTAFQIACKKGHFKIVELLIQKSGELKIDLNAKNFEGNSPLHMACSHRCP